MQPVEKKQIKISHSYFRYDLSIRHSVSSMKLRKRDLRNTKRLYIEIDMLFFAPQ